MSDNANNKIMRGTGLLIIEVRDSNPNGDPDRESDPRQRPDKRGEISPVSFKAKLRSLVENKEGPVWLAIKDAFDLKQERFEILESRQRQKSEINEDEETFKNKFWDGRLFGNTELEKGREVPVKTGVVQFGMGISVSPIEIGRYTTTNPPVEIDKKVGMAPLAYRIVRHAVYSMPFFINPTAATKSGCTKVDIDVMLRLIPWAYCHTRSYMRPFVEIRHAWYMEHTSPLGSCADFALIDAMKPTRREGFNPEKPSKSWDEYSVPDKLPGELANRVKPLQDLMNEAAETISTQREA